MHDICVCVDCVYVCVCLYSHVLCYVAMVCVCDVISFGGMEATWPHK